jgi:hypothetical protein
MDFCNQDGKSLLRGTNWAFKYNSSRFVLRELQKEYRPKMCKIGAEDDIWTQTKQ